MIFRRRKASDEQATPSPTDKPDKKSWLSRLTQGLSKTRQQLGESLADAVLGKKTIDDALFETLETQLLMSDVGVDATNTIIQQLTQQVSRKALKDGDALLAALKECLQALLRPAEKPLTLQTNGLTSLLMVGINGAGKTTTIGKLAHYFQAHDHSVMLAAGDTFRAAAVEQLVTWGERNSVPVIAQKTGADSASVAYDALHSAKAKQVDVLITDTAGRLHTQDHLMDELKKVKRVMQKVDEHAPHEVLLVLDASIGQNALVQAKQFHEAVGVTGIVITKLDGTAKGGVIFAIAQSLQLPIYFIGVGEGIEDLKPFSADEFVQALFD